MEIIAGTTDFYLEKDTAVAIGKFDGVHLGHRRLLEEILGRKNMGWRRACSPLTLHRQCCSACLTVKN